MRHLGDFWPNAIHTIVTLLSIGVGGILLVLTGLLVRDRNARMIRAKQAITAAVYADIAQQDVGNAGSHNRTHHPITVTIHALDRCHVRDAKTLRDVALSDATQAHITALLRASFAGLSFVPAAMMGIVMAHLDWDEEGPAVVSAHTTLHNRAALQPFGAPA